MTPTNTLINATCPEDVFGDLGFSEQSEALKHIYFNLAKVFHPDKGGSSEEFSKLQFWHEKAKEKIGAGTYGNRAPDTTIRVGRKTYKLGKLVASGDLSDCYLASTDVDKVLLKITRSHQNNDLTASEAEILRYIKNDSIASGLAVTENHIPTLVDTFEISKPVKKRVNVFQLLEGFYSLRELRERFPNGIPCIHAVWMFNRMLGAFASAHQAGGGYGKGIVHGAVTPDHIMINPTNHNGVLIDWSYAVRLGEKLKAVPGKWKGLYPYLKEPATFGLDIYMLAGCFIYATGGDPFKQIIHHSVPRAISGFIRSCLFKGKRQPQDALDLYKEFAEILVRVYGLPKFRILEVP